jgi:hypothetical protein
MPRKKGEIGKQILLGKEEIKKRDQPGAALNALRDLGDKPNSLAKLCPAFPTSRR